MQNDPAKSKHYSHAAHLTETCIANPNHLRNNTCSMQWIAPSEKDPASATLEKQLRAAADQLRARPRPQYPAFAEARFDHLLH